MQLQLVRSEFHNNDIKVLIQCLFQTN